MKLRNCPNCNEQNPATQQFCGDCGTDIDKAEYDAKNNPVKKVEDLEKIVREQGEEIERLKKGGKEDGGSEGNEKGNKQEKGGAIS